ncbi:MAG: hypothetical protein H6737_31375 [Alphaproteobacteria bacterium]|nr:hypothetical protein [Alphaproteobacteria bacterium]
MLSTSLLILVGLAHAEEPCPPLDPLLNDAQRDALSFFLADAQATLTAADRSFGCAEVSPPSLARYWQIQAMIWHLQEREGDAERAMGAAKLADGEVFDDELGAEVRGLWEAAGVPVGETVRVRLRGTRRGDVLKVDTRQMPEAVVVPGFHLVQVVRDGAVVFGSVADVPAGGLDLVVSADAPAPAPASSTAFALPGVTAPLTSKGARVLDATGARVSFGQAVLPASLLAEGGFESWSQRRRNARLQGVAIGTTAFGTWVSYLYAWDLSVGKNLPSSRSSALLGTGVAIAGSGLVWEAILLAKRRASRRRTVDLANRALVQP